jgi:hypothetical protein
MPLATENWSERKWQPKKSASQVFIVTDVPNMDVAKSIGPVPQANSQFVLDSTLRAQQPVVTSPDSPLVFNVAIEFLPPGGGGSSGSNQPTNTPVLRHPQVALSTESVDADINGNPIVNSARDAFQQPQSKRFPSVRYVYKRWESNFDGPRAVAYTGTVNNDLFNMPGFGSVQVGQAFCESITVASAFDQTATSVLVVYTFELRGDGFKTRILDQGPNAYYSQNNASAKGRIYTQGGDIVPLARLNGLGNVFDATLRVGSPSSLGQGIGSTPPGAELEITPNGRFLKYTLYASMPFNGLTLT